ncbi:dienelactone hydrolase family protein [Halostagnicola sp. A-GB9-2]|uniref:dienelactone hydrolase family protein n=1 Tax=Halostagnicola sp. A-GB9-2 TaxID=3048066 RepID=UPI0024BFF488|nr:dienelactone hydrolase family protein [Halostagnicola sp. A-GB9-2]MDJ1434255.1 dienelactone hydrolase family protein [Halostagnicola sp. A-GB9-2]
MGTNVNLIVTVTVDEVPLEGELIVPDGATGLVLFAHGSGSSRHSPRNNFVAERIRERGVGTLLFDLLTEAEDRTYETRFDIPLLTDRLVGATRWVRSREDTADLKIGYFGSSTGSAAALRAAARPEIEIAAVVSRGGRVDMAEDILDQVSTATMFVVGGNDHPVLEWNEEALELLAGEKSLEVVEGASHLFEEPGALESVADHAAKWFSEYLS